MNGLSLRGVIVPLVTPFHEDGQVNHPALRQLVDFLLENGVHGLFVAGTTGEGPLLSLAERRAVAETVVDQAGGRAPVLVQAGTPSTEETVALVEHAHATGADGAALLCPYFFRLSEEALIRHFCTVAERAPGSFPLYLYNIPQLTGNNISPAVSQAVAQECPNVLGEKDSSGNLLQIIDKLGVREGDFQMLVGSDGLILPGLVAGVAGAVSGNANVFPELFVALFEAYWRGDLTDAQELQERIHRVRRILRDGGDISLFKAMLAHRGIEAGPVRAPLVNATPATVRACREELQEMGLPV